MAFDPDAYLSENEEPKTKDSFDPDAYLDESEPKRSLAGEVEKVKETDLENQVGISPSRSVLIGAGQSATFGFGEELTAPLAAAVGMATQDLPSLPEESTWEKYQRLMQEYRDTARDEQQAAQEQNPKSYLAGALVGGVASPGLGAAKALGATTKLAKTAVKAGIPSAVVRTAAPAVNVGIGAGVGAGMGAAAGLGEAEGSISERLPEAKESMLMGAGIGAALPLAAGTGKKIGELAGEVAELPMIKRGLKTFESGTKGKNLYTEKGLKEAEQAVYNQSEKMYNTIQDVRQEIGKQIEAKIQQADASGQKVDLTSVMDDAYARLDELEAGNPGQETLSYIKSLKAELNQLLGVKPQSDDFMGVAKSDLPEGLVTPAKSKPSFEVAPSKAREIKQNIYGYTPSNVKTQTGTVSPLVSKPASVAQDVYSGVDQSLEDAIGQLDSNQKYSVIKDTLKRLISKEKQFEEMDVEKINDMLKKIEDPASGKSSRLLEWTMQQLDEVDPKIRQELETGIKESVEQYKLAKDIQSGGIFSGILGTQRSMGGTAANIAGLAARKTGLVGLTNAGKSFTKAVLESKPGQLTSEGIQTATRMSPVAGTISTISKEPYKLQRQVANAAENADPELLKEQAQSIRNQHGKTGEQLATILENMADKDKDARRALMFTILQNHAYRKMLGLQNEEEK